MRYIHSIRKNYNIIFKFTVEFIYYLLHHFGIKILIIIYT